MYLVINKCVTAVILSNFSRHYLRSRSTSHIVFWVITVYFNVRNILPKSGTFPPGHPYNTHCFSTARRAEERRPHVTLCVHCLSLLILYSTNYYHQKKLRIFPACRNTQCKWLQCRCHLASRKCDNDVSLSGATSYLGAVRHTPAPSQRHAHCTALG